MAGGLWFVLRFLLIVSGIAVIVVVLVIQVIVYDRARFGELNIQYEY